MLTGRPAMAQVVIVPIVKKGNEEEATGVAAAVAGLRDAAAGAGLRVHVDDSEGRSPGWKFNFWEMKARCHSSAFLIKYHSYW